MTLGLIPGATGITKTVRLLGLLAAQPYLLEGKLFGPREAVELGLVDGLATDAEEMRAAALAWIAAHPDAKQPWDEQGLPDARRHAVEPEDRGRRWRSRRRCWRRRRAASIRRPQAILETMVEGALVDYDTATRIESRKLAKVMVAQTAKNMIRRSSST